MTGEDVENPAPTVRRMRGLVAGRELLRARPLSPVARSYDPKVEACGTGCSRRWRAEWSSIHVPVGNCFVKPAG